MASRILRFILILFIVSVIIFSYVSKSRTMAKLDLKPSEDKDPSNAFAAGSNAKHNHIMNGLVPFSDSSMDKNHTRMKFFLNKEQVLAPLELVTLDSLIPIRMPLAGAVYEPGHLDNAIDVERICPLDGSHTKLLVLITSAVHHTAARMAIRQTWMHYGSRRDVGMAFVLGQSTDKSLNTALNKEDSMYRDLIRGNFVDSYNNLTLKTMSSLEWTHRHCLRAKYVLKTDDDMFINVPKLLAFVDTLKANRTIYGRRAENWLPVRNKWSKYYIPIAQYTKKVFPCFTTGPAYLMTGDIVGDLLVGSLNTPFIRLEDVFTTGIVAESLAIKRVNVREIANVRMELEPCRIRDKITVHMVRPNEQFDVWKKLLDDSIKCKNGKRIAK